MTVLSLRKFDILWSVSVVKRFMCDLFIYFCLHSFLFITFVTSLSLFILIMGNVAFFLSKAERYIQHCWECKQFWSPQWNVIYKCWQPFNSLTLSILLSVSVLSLTHKTTLSALFLLTAEVIVAIRGVFVTCVYSRSTETDGKTLKAGEQTHKLNKGQN